MSKIFISYSHRDENWKDELQAHLAVLKHGQQLSLWDDRLIKSGDDWFGEITKQIDASAIAILLISKDFLASDFVCREEIPRLLKLKEANGLRIVPLILRPCAWQSVPWLAKLQGAIKDNLPLSRFQFGSYELESELSSFAIRINDILVGISAKREEEQKRVEREAAAKREEEQKRVEREAAAKREEEQKRVEREAAAKREEEQKRVQRDAAARSEIQPQPPIGRAKQKRLEREAAAKHEEEQKRRQLEARTKLEENLKNRSVPSKSESESGDLGSHIFLVAFLLVFLGLPLIFLVFGLIYS